MNFQKKNRLPKVIEKFQVKKELMEGKCFQK